jgi:hypothetical protein
VAATIPSVPTEVKTLNSVSDLTTKVKISWTAPTDLGGTGITIEEYSVLVRQSDASTFTQTALGSGCRPADPTAIAKIVTDAYCEIEMQAFLDAPYSLI